jgi:hypothetical protein
MDETSDLSPDRKVVAAGLGGAVATIVVLGAQWLGAPEAPSGLEGAIATVVAFAAGYWVRR